MKRGFTLVELLAVIIILAVISTIVLPIVINTVNDSKKSTYRSSIDLYGKAVKQAVLNYELDKKVTPTSFEQIKPYLEFDGNNVECNTKIIYEDGEIYLKDCSVDGNLVEDYTYGKRTLSDTILKHATDNNYYYKTKPDFTKATEDGEFGLYVAKDDLGDSYYFRGDVENNYVVFGKWNEIDTVVYLKYEGSSYPQYGTLEHCNSHSNNACYEELKVTAGEDIIWKIVRINGDGTIRLVYSGTEKYPNFEYGINMNPKGYMYYDNETTWYDMDKVDYTYEENGEEKDSDIKEYLESWYEKNLKKNYDKYVADAIYCNDRTIFEEEYYDASGNSIDSFDEAIDGRVVFAGVKRYEDKEPILTCTNEEDRYSVTSIGNSKLTYPIGLLNMDEYLMIDKKSTYQGFWTMTPYYLENNEYVDVWNAYVFWPNNNLGQFEHVSLGGAILPVINLKADVRFTGTGTEDDPYVIMTD